jgi:NADPH-dependent F420 reductase
MNLKTIAVIGGTGDLGGGLAVRLACAGFGVVIGSRSQDRAQDVARALSAEAGSAAMRGLDNVAAAESGDLLIVTVPFDSQASTLRSISEIAAGKIVVDTTVPLVPPKVARVQLPPEGSAARVAAAALGKSVRLVSAFHNVSAQKLRGGDNVQSDILVFGDDVEARETVVELIARMNMRGLHGGPLDNAVAAEAMTSVLISMNKRYAVAEGAGIRITGIAGAAT